MNKQDYIECSKAMLKIWINNVITDGEYNRIMDKLNNSIDDNLRASVSYLHQDSITKSET